MKPHQIFPVTLQPKTAKLYHVGDDIASTGQTHNHLDHIANLKLTNIPIS